MTSAEAVIADGGRSEARGDRRSSRLTSRLGWILTAFVAVAPIPLGSARPLGWTVNAVVLALIGLWYFSRTGRESTPLRSPAFGWIAVPLFCLVCLYLAVQAVPGLGNLAPILTPNGDAIGNAALSLDPGQTCLALLRFLSYGIFALLAAQVAANPERGTRLLEFVFAAIVVHAVYGLIALTALGDTVLFFRKWTYFGFATGTFVNRNSFATFLAMGLVLGLGLTFFSRRRAEQIGASHFQRLALVLVGLAVIIAALLQTQSRMGLFAGVSGAGVTTILCIMRLSISRLSKLAIMVALVAGFGAAMVLFGGGVTERLGSSEVALDVRLDLYRQVWGMIWQRPLLGYGGGTFEAIYPLFQRPPVSPDLIWDSAHDTYLTLWSELGLIAGSIPILIVALSAIGALRRWGSSEDWAAPAIAVGVIVTCALHSLVDFSLEIEANAFLFIFVLTLGATRLRRSAQAKSHTSG